MINWEAQRAKKYAVDCGDDNYTTEDYENAVDEEIEFDLTEFEKKEFYDPDAVEDLDWETDATNLGIRINATVKAWRAYKEVIAKIFLDTNDETIIKYFAADDIEVKVGTKEEDLNQADYLMWNVKQCIEGLGE